MAFAGKVVLVTGAGSGIGAATAYKFSAEGAHVCLVDINEEKLSNVAKKCENSFTVIADVSKDEDAKRIVNETVKHFGKLDVLVNNAGIFKAPSSEENVIKDFDQLMAINLRAPVVITNFAIPHLVKTKGNIVNTSSVGSVLLSPGVNFGYFVAKAGLDHFIRSIALELAPEGIRVNGVNPGPVKSGIVDAVAADSQVDVESIYEGFKNKTALNRVCEPEEVADLILFLASDKAKGITGSSFRIDNGMLIKAGS